ncbi:hypothetical protein TI04_02620, partial [Achromatium sp. WMS2]
MAQIHDAVDRGDVATIKRLIASGVGIDTPAEDGWSPLNIAALGGQTAVAEYLINAGANVNATVPNGGGRPLFIAAQGGYLAIVKLLVASGAQIDAQSNDGGRALTNAVQNGHKDVVAFLIHAGAKLDALPLAIAAEAGHLDIVQLLIDKKADINATDRVGFTPLHMAAQKGHRDVAQFLLEHGANVDIRNHAGSTPDDIAHLHGHPDLVKLIAGYRVQKPGAGTYCSMCGRGVIMSWTCPKCDKLLCDTCSGLTTTKPEVHQEFTVLQLGGGEAKCPYCDAGISLEQSEIEIVQVSTSPKQPPVVEAASVVEVAPPPPLPKVATLTLDTRPKGAQIKLLNQPWPYKPGMSLPLGSYPIEVSAPGYHNLTQTIELHQDVTLPLALQPQAIPAVVQRGHTNYVNSVAFSPDGIILASGSWDNSIKLWRVADGALLLTFTGHTSSVKSVAFSPDGSSLASGSWDKTIKLWRVADGVLLRTLTGHANLVYSVAFSPDGLSLASG